MAEHDVSGEAVNTPLRPASFFDSAYESGSPPWLIGEPQPRIMELESDGWIRGAVLDAGCGSGEHTIYLANLGYDVLGVDFSARALEKARANAGERHIETRFELADALHLGDEPRFDTVIDSALFHVFAVEERAQYTRSLHTVCRPGAFVHLLALSDAEPGLGPQISDTAIREAFREGWVLEDLQPSRYRVIVDPDAGRRLGLEAGAPADMLAWLARVRRI
jgi:SAM-dependent methyltransferase